MFLHKNLNQWKVNKKKFKNKNNKKNKKKRFL